jgi:hypothetical protein
MSLPARQQRLLRDIEGRLGRSDPQLRSLFTIFTRLTLDEAMPWFEAVKFRPVADRLAAVGGLFRRALGHPAARVRALLLLPVALTAIICATLVTSGFSGPARSHPAVRAPAARELVVKTGRLCRLRLLRVPAFAC